MNPRAIVFWLHLAFALTAGAVIVVMAGTGVLLTYQAQIVEWADLRGVEASASQATVARVPVDSLIARARSAAPGIVTGVRYRASADAPVEVQFGRERSVFLNGWTGEVVGRSSDGARAFFGTVTDVHRWFALRGDARRAGRAVTGAANVAFLFIVMSGLVLWLPRRVTRHALRNALLPRRALRSKARHFNWHHVAGIWAALPLLVIIASGAVISYAWAGALVERIAGEDRPVPSPSANSEADTTARLLTTDELLTLAERKLDDWHTITLELPTRGQRVTFTIGRGREGQPQKHAELTLSQTGREVSWITFADESRPERVRDVLRYLHTGEVLGPAGQTIAGAASAAVLLLAWTGASLALTRLRSWRRRRA